MSFCLHYQSTIVATGVSLNIIGLTKSPISNNFTNFYFIGIADSLYSTMEKSAVFDFQATTADGQILNKLIFFNWAPDTARVKSKMMYASTKDFFKGHLDGISAEFQASDLDEITESAVEETVQSLKRG